MAFYVFFQVHSANQHLSGMLSIKNAARTLPGGIIKISYYLSYYLPLLRSLLIIRYLPMTASVPTIRIQLHQGALRISKQRTLIHI